jgi:glycosyltransferase involved in cell wall biosynthesis
MVAEGLPSDSWQVPVFSIIIPTRNRGPALRVVLDGLLAQRTDIAHEIIVVDNGSSDDTSRIVHSVAPPARGGLRYVFEPTPGTSGARNAGIRAARGEIIAFLDDDVVVQPGWLQALNAAYRAFPDAWGIGGRIILQLPERLPPWFDPESETLRGYLSGLDRGEGLIRLEHGEALWTANFSMTRHAFSRVGVFDLTLGRTGSRLVVGEDTELCHRVHKAGGVLYYCGQAIVTHPVPDARLTKQWLRNRAYWQGRTGRRGWMREEPPLAQLVRLAMAGVVGARALWFYGTGNSRRGMNCELAARAHLGHVQEALGWGRPTRGERTGTEPPAVT